MTRKQLDALRAALNEANRKAAQAALSRLTGALL